MPRATPPARPQPGDVIGNALQLMHGSQDEAKFAGLLLLVKHLSTTTTSPTNATSDNNDIRRLVLEAVTPQFLARLLASRASSPNSQHFRGVALAVLSTLVQDPTLVPRLRPLLKHVLSALDDISALSQASQGLVIGYEEARMNVVEDCLFFLYALTQHDRTVACVREFDTLEVFRRVTACMLELRNMRITISNSISSHSSSSSSSSGSSSSSSSSSSGSRSSNCRSRRMGKIEENEVTEAAEAVAAMKTVDEEGKGGTSDASPAPPPSSSTDTQNTTITTDNIPSATVAAGTIDHPTRLLTEACATLHEVLLMGHELQCPQRLKPDDRDTLVTLSFILEEEGGDVKLRILHLLNFLFSHVRSSHQAAAGAAAGSARDGSGGERYMTNTSVHMLGRHMRGALLQLLHGALRERNRDPALRLLVHTLAIFGQTWAIEDEDEEGREEGKEKAVLSINPRAEGERKGVTGMSRGTCVGFFVHVLSAETRMAAEELESLANVGEEVMEKDLSLKDRLGRVKEMIPLCVDGLDSVLRFLCGAGDGPECLLLQQQEDEEYHNHQQERTKTWVMLPGEKLLEIRASLHDAIGALLKLLHDGAREWKQQQQQRQNSSAGEEAKKGELEMEGVYREVARFLSAVLAEDEACMTGEEALSVLPFVMYLAGETEGGGGGYEGGREGGRVGWVLPWVSRVLSPGTAEEEAEEGIAVLFRLVDECQIHLWFAKHLLRPLLPISEKGEKQHIDFLLLFHDILFKGGDSVLSDDHACLLAHHPQVLSLVRHLVLGNSSLFSPYPSLSYIRVRLYQVWFVLSLLWGRADSNSSSRSSSGRAVGGRKGQVEKGEGFAQEVLQRVLPVGSKEYWAWMEGVGGVLIEGMKLVQQGAPTKMEEEDRQELEGLWGQSVDLLSIASEDVRRNVLQASAFKYGKREVEMLEGELMLVGAASAVLS